MVSKTFLLIILAFATALLITSEVAAAMELTSNHDSSEVEDANGGGVYKGLDPGNPTCGNSCKGGRYDPGKRCRYYSCCGGRIYEKTCRCCSTLEEANAYKQAQEDQTHN